MKSHSQESDAYELTEKQLDTILRRVHDDIVAHVQGVVDPSRSLIAIMTDSERTKIPEHDRAFVERRCVPEKLSAVIETRSRAAEVHQRLGEVVRCARNLARDLDLELRDHGDLAIAVLSAIAFARQRDRQLAQLLSHARDLAVQVAYDLIHIQELDRTLTADKDAEVIREHSISNVIRDQAFDGIRELDRYFAANRQILIDEQIKDARELSIRLENARRLSDFRERWRNLDREHAHDLALSIDLALVNAKDLADSVIGHLNAVEVNAVAADLSRVKICDPATLTGVIWADTTIWPSDVAEDIGPLSEELATGIYQIRPDGQRPTVSQGRHAVDRLPISVQALYGGHGD
jgi:hypothetical protein